MTKISIEYKDSWIIQRFKMTAMSEQQQKKAIL